MKKKLLVLAVALMMIFSLGGCGDKEIIEVDVDDMIDCSNFHYNEIAGFPWRPIGLWHEDENAVFYCKADGGTFVLLSDKTQFVKDVIKKPGDELYWQPRNLGLEGNALSENTPEDAVIEILIRFDNNIIGYAVIEIYSVGIPGLYYKASVLKSAAFPKTDGGYQSVTENQVNALIGKIKDER